MPDPIAFNNAGDSSNAAPGTGNVNLDNAITGLRRISAACTTGDTVCYRVETSDGSEWEVGRTTVVTGTPWTLTRGGSQTVLDSSNSGSAVNFSGAVEARLVIDERWLNALFLPAVSETVTTSDPTVTLNRNHRLTIAGLTASRNFTVPAPGAVGDRIGIEIEDGDADHEIIIIGDTGINVGGAGAATEWSRLFIAGEKVILRAISSTEWRIDRDDRVPCRARMHNSVATSAGSINTFYQMQLDTSVFDEGDIADNTNDRIVLRRAAKGLRVWAGAQPENSLADQESWTLEVRKNGSTTSVVRSGTRMSGAGTVIYLPLGSLLDDPADGDYYEVWIRAGATATRGQREFLYTTYFTAEEVLR